jgi:hypothetical protein
VAFEDGGSVSLSKYLMHEIGLSKAERIEVLASARQASMRDLSRSLRGTGLLLVSILGGFLVFALMKVGFKIAGTGLSPVWATMIAGGSGAIVPSVFVQHRLPRFVYAELRSRGHDVCPGCGYPRRGLADAEACPECGVPAASASEGGP